MISRVTVLCALAHGAAGWLLPPPAINTADVGDAIAEIEKEISAAPAAAPTAVPLPRAAVVNSAPAPLGFVRNVDGGLDFDVRVNGSVPASFDLRNVSGHSWLNGVRNHHLPLGTSCASCWAINTGLVVSNRLNIAVAGEGYPTIQVSPQYLLNCVPGQEHCGYPGSSSAALRFIQSNGIVDEACAPWENVKHPCDGIHICARMEAPDYSQPQEDIDPYRPTPTPKPMTAVVNPTKYRIQSDNKIEDNFVAKIQAAVLSGPVACGVHVPDSLAQFTGKSVYTDTDHGDIKIDHSVSIVGWGTDAESGHDYWVMENNWGTWWGDGGYAKMLRGVDILGLESKCHFPIVEKPKLD